MKSDEMLDAGPAPDAYADIEEFIGGGSPPTVEQGNFSAPPKTELPDAEVEPVSRAVDLGPGSIEVTDEKALEAEAARLKAELALLELSPENRYRKRLELEGITLDNARTIVDTIVVQLGQYHERVNLTKTLTIEVQTRKAKDQAMLANVVEARQPRYNMTFDHIVQVQNVAASLVRYGSKEFKRETEKDLEEIVTWLEELPVPIFYLLVEKVRDFDRKIAYVFQEGYLENF